MQNKMTGQEVEIVKKSINEEGKKNLLTILENELDQMNRALYCANEPNEMFRIQGQVIRLQWMLKMFGFKTGV